VIAPTPCGEPVGRPSGAGGGGGAGRVVGPEVAGAGALATRGNSFCPGRGSAGARDGSVRSGSARLSRGSAARVGSSVGRVARSGGRAASRSGNAGVGVGGVGSRGAVVSGARDRGEPTAATAGTRFTTYVFGWLARHAWPASRITAASETCSSAESASPPSGTRARRSAGPRRLCGRRVAI